MKFISRTVSGITVDQVDRWVQEDVVHGFLCRDADLGEKRERFGEKLREIAPRKPKLFFAASAAHEPHCPCAPGF